MITVITSIVVYEPNMDDLKVLFSSYKQSIEYAKKMHDIQDTVVIVDNNPSSDYEDEIVSLLEKNTISYRYIKSSINGGYGHGHNQSIELMKSDYHIICNPDIEFENDTISVGIGAMEARKNVVLLSPAVFSFDGERQFLCKRNPSLLHLFLRRFSPNFINKIFFEKYLERYEYRDKSYDEEIKNVPFCTGCFMLFKTDTLLKLNGFDENIFMYLEDADLSRRALCYGETLYLPTFKVRHRWERGAYKNKKLRNALIKSAFYYSYKWGVKRVFNVK
jgi:GT2 family glycosyltransferase